MVAIEDGIVTLVNFVQLLNEYLSNDITESGMTYVVFDDADGNKIKLVLSLLNKTPFSDEYI
jgi:hypothetical protein